MTKEQEIFGRIKNYLGNGGLFNPELMEPDKVRDLLMDCGQLLSDQFKAEAKKPKATSILLGRKEEPYTYASTQSTICAGCGKDKHTPLRNDDMGGYVCLTCIDRELARQQAYNEKLKLAARDMMQCYESKWSDEPDALLALRKTLNLDE
jgi:hypothetical protein